MKVVVGKMPGGRAVTVEIADGGTVLEAIKEAGYENDVNNGYEARLNGSPTELTSIVGDNSLITLTSKITGNSLSAISVISIADIMSSEVGNFISEVPTIIHSFANIPDVFAAIKQLANIICPNSVYCTVIKRQNDNTYFIPEASKIVLYDDLAICSNVAVKIESSDYVVFSDASVANHISNMGYTEALKYVEGFLYPQPASDNEDGNKKDDEACVCEDASKNCNCGETCVHEANYKNENATLGEFVSYVENSLPTQPASDNEDDKTCACEDTGENCNCGETCVCEDAGDSYKNITLGELASIAKRFGINMCFTIDGLMLRNNK